MNAFTVLSALLLTCAAGFGITLPLLAKREKISLAELAALSWLLGTAFISLAMWIAGFWMREPWLPGVTALCCIALFFRGIAILRKGRARLEWPRAWRVRDMLLCGFLAMELMVMLGMAYRTSMGWDGIFSWEWRARLAFFNGGHIPLYYYSNPAGLPDYPLFLPMNETWLYFWMGDTNQFWVRVLFPPFYIAAVLLLYTGCAQLTGNRTAGLVTACMLFFVPEVMSGPGAVNSGYADFPLAVFYLAAVVQLLIFLRNDTPSSLLLFALLAGLLPWIKRDGGVLWGVILIAGAIALALRRRSMLVFAGIAAPGVLMIGTWTIFLKTVHTADNIAFLPMTPAILRQNINRVIPLARRVGYELLYFDRWSLLWICFAVAIIHLALTKRGKLAGFSLLLTAWPVALFCGSYLFSSWADYTRHVDSSLPRLLMQVTPVVLLAIGIAITGREDRDLTLKNQPAGESLP